MRPRFYRKHVHPLVGPCGVCDAPELPPDHDNGCGCILFVIVAVATLLSIFLSMNE